MRFEDRLAIVALALLEGPSPQTVDGLRPGPLEARALERAELLPDGARVRDALESIGAWPRSVARIVVAILVLAVATGLAAVVSSTETVSVPAVLVGTLGLQSLLLAAWIVALLPGAGPLLRRGCAALVSGPVRTLGSLRERATDAVAGAVSGAAAPRAAGEWAQRRVRRAEIDHAAALAATGAVALTYASKRSVLAALVYGAWSNTAWIAANLLVLGMLSLRLLGSRTYTLHSGLLSPEVTRAWVDGILRVLGWFVPAGWLPDAEALARASMEPAGVASDSWRWGSMLVLSVAVFGLLPRVAALLVAVLWLPAARRRWRIPWDDRRLAATRAVIESARPPTIVVARERDAVAPSGVGAGRAVRPGRAPGVLRIGAAAPWTPSLPAVDLGSLDERGLAGAEAIAARIAAEAISPVVLLVDLLSTPRRGVVDYLAPITAAGACVAVLSEGSRLRRGTRPEDLAIVVRAWRSRLEEAGVTTIHEIDAGLRTSTSGAMLEALLSGHGVRAGGAGRLAKSFERITDAERDLGQLVPGAADERRLLDALGSIHGIDRLADRAPHLAVLGADARAWWSGGADRLLHAVAGGPGVAESSLGASSRRTLLVNAAMVAAELEFQGCGEATISDRMERIRAALEGDAGRSAPERGMRFDEALRRAADAVGATAAESEARR